MDVMSDSDTGRSGMKDNIADGLDENSPELAKIILNYIGSNSGLSLEGSEIECLKCGRVYKTLADMYNADNCQGPDINLNDLKERMYKDIEKTKAMHADELLDYLQMAELKEKEAAEDAILLEKELAEAEDLRKKEMKKAEALKKDPAETEGMSQAKHGAISKAVSPKKKRVHFKSITRSRSKKITPSKPEIADASQSEKKGGRPKGLKIDDKKRKPILRNDSATKNVDKKKEVVHKKVDSGKGSGLTTIVRQKPSPPKIKAAKNATSEVNTGKDSGTMPKVGQKLISSKPKVTKNAALEVNSKKDSELMSKPEQKLISSKFKVAKNDALEVIFEKNNPLMPKVDMNLISSKFKALEVIYHKDAGLITKVGQKLSSPKKKILKKAVSEASPIASKGAEKKKSVPLAKNLSEIKPSKSSNKTATPLKMKKASPQAPKKSTKGRT